MKLFGIEEKGKTKRFYFLGVPVYSRKKEGYKTIWRFLVFRFSKYDFHKELKELSKSINELRKKVELQGKKERADVSKSINELRKKVELQGKKERADVSKLNNFINLALRQINNNNILDDNNDLSSEKKKVILYVMDVLRSAGGVETRLLKQFSFLSENGYECMIMTMEGNDFKPLCGYKNVNLNFDAENFSTALVDFIKLNHIDIVEFQAKSTNYFENIDFTDLRKYCKVGLCLHGIVRYQYVDFSCFDYVFRANASRGLNFLKAIPYIPNWIPECKPVWSYRGQKKAIFISRLNDNEKLPTLNSFIGSCREIGCDFVLAGNMDNSDKGNKIRPVVLDLGKERYLGVIDTLSYLREHADEILFVGGVGQVSIEAASLGFPSLVCTHLADSESSRFVTSQNIDGLIENNFVINTNRYLPSDEFGNVSHFMQAVAKQEFSDFNLISLLQEKLSEEKVLTKYQSILEDACPVGAGIHLFALIAVKDEERYLKGFFEHLRDYVDGFVVLDDGSTDATASIISQEPKVLSVLTNAPHGPEDWDEKGNRIRLLEEAYRLGGDVVLCCDADERFEIGFCQSLRAYAAECVRYDNRVFGTKLCELWDSPTEWRKDGIWNKKVKYVLFSIKERMTFEQTMRQKHHIPYYHDAVTEKKLLNYRNYHLKMVRASDRKKRADLYEQLDPNHEMQPIGYRYLTDPDGLQLESIRGHEYDLKTLPQDLAFRTALLEGSDVDKPRNLAKSVTVE